MNPIIPVIVVGIILIFLDNIPRFGLLASNFFLGLVFMFAAARLNSEIAIYYSIMLTIITAWSIKGLGEKDINKISLFGSQIKGWWYSILMVIVGLSLYFVMRTLSISRGGLIIGVPTLSAATSTTMTALNPMLLGALGFIENRFFFVLFDILGTWVLPYIPIPIFTALPFVAPIAIVALAFGFFHSLVLSGLVIFAAMVMSIWLLMYLLDMPQATNISHYLWNSTIGLAQVGLRIFGG